MLLGPLKFNYQYIPIEKKHQVINHKFFKSQHKNQFDNNVVPLAAQL